MTTYKTLEEIMNSHGTDKAAWGHGYAERYDQLFSHLRDKPITLLEIGVWEGKSLASWREYFLNPNAKIVGLDKDLSRLWSAGIFPSSLNLKYEYALGNNVSVVECNVASNQLSDWLGRMNERFDIVVDDGNHHVHSHIAAHAHLWPWLRPGGLYCIEDVHTYWNMRHNPPDALDWLDALGRDALGRGEEHSDTDIESVSFYNTLAVIQKKHDV